MVKHLAYFDALGSLTEQSPAWQSVLAGLATLRLADATLEKTPAASADWASVYRARRTASAMREGNPVRAALLHVVETIGLGTSVVEVANGLLSYARALDFEGSWPLAMDVFTTVAESVGPELDPHIAIEANIGLGGMARRTGDWHTSAQAYAHAAHIAQTIGDTAHVLTVEIGQANTALTRGNLPAAESILENVIGEARARNLGDVLGLALHSRSSVAHARREYADAVRLAHESLDFTTNASARDVVLSDLAAAFGGLGMHDSARDGYLVVAATSQYQWVRWQATLNLMELASLDGMEQAFEQYAAELKDAALDPRLRAYFLLYLGAGAGRFGRLESAESALNEAIRYASDHQISQVAHEATIALAELRKDVARIARTRSNNAFEVELPADVQNVASALGLLREAAVGSP
jgi:tetratricopeptide (TPR) repeat protein